MTNNFDPPRVMTRNSDKLPPPGGHYSHVCIAGGMAYVSGLLPLNPDGTSMKGRPFDAQAQQVLKSLDACLHSVGAGPQDVVQVRVYVTDMDNWPCFNEYYAAWMKEHRPARIVLAVASLHFGVDVEVEAVAVARL